jgi:hypothetical protein
MRTDINPCLSVVKSKLKNPFYKHRLADFTSSQFLTSKYHPDLELLLK